MERSPCLTGLFLGAGASYEAGMPLVSGLTTEIKNWLTGEKLRSLNDSWRSLGGGYHEETINDFAAVLSRPDLHYENLLGHLEIQYRRRLPRSDEFHALYSWLVEIVYHLLYFRHINNIDLIKSSLSNYKGLSNLAHQNNPLWVFSINHDLVIESLAIQLGIPLSSGFTDKIVSFPRRNQQGEIIGQLTAEVLPRDHLESSSMSFFHTGTFGINLLKIHGSLDVFAFRDGNDLAKIKPLSESADGYLEALRATNEELQYQPKIPIRALNEIVYTDDTGEMQFLRRSLLAGAFKFDSKNSQVLPHRYLQFFKSYIDNLGSLICIGYGFGDDHVNSVIRGWLEFSEDRRLTIVDPGVDCIPPMCRHLAPQVELDSNTTGDYLDSRAGIIRSKNEILKKKLTSWFRKNPQTGLAEFVNFVRTQQEGRLKEWFESLPCREGQIDIESLDMTMEELIEEAKRQVFTLEETIDEFFGNSER